MFSRYNFGNSKNRGDKMNALDEILEIAEKRASAKNLPYKNTAFYYLSDPSK